MIIGDFFLWFILYSMIGWIMETILCSINEKRLAKRGFLYGPYCPIYGFGAVLCLLLLGRIENPVALFFAAMALCGTLEYITGWLLERLFHQKWWDYSDMPLNLHGRVCLAALIVFGALIVFLLKAMHPFLLTYYNPLASATRLSLARGAGALFVLDLSLTIARLKGLLPSPAIREWMENHLYNKDEIKERLKVQLAEVSVRLPSPTSIRQAITARKESSRFTRWR